MDTSLFVEKLGQHIEYRLDQSKIKLTDLVLEELISFALEDSQHSHLYESGSHRKGGDISTHDITSSADHSIKSSKNENGYMDISSFRLTRFGTNLSAMLEFIDNAGKNYDDYFVLSRNESDVEVKYSFYILPSNIFVASDMEWVEKRSSRGVKSGQLTGWKTINNDNINLKIEISMSNQLWIRIKQDHIKDYLKLEITKNISDLGKNRFVAI